MTYFNTFEVEKAVEDYFTDNWDGEIRYANTKKRPDSAEWIVVEVAPVFTDPGISGCIEVLHIIHITCNSRTKVSSAILADRATKFLCGAKLAGSTVGAWRPVAQGTVFNGLHFRKMSFPLSVTTRCCF